MKSFILATLAALTITFAGLAGADWAKDQRGAYPEGSIQTSAE